MPLTHPGLSIGRNTGVSGASAAATVGTARVTLPSTLPQKLSAATWGFVLAPYDFRGDTSMFLFDSTPTDSSFTYYTRLSTFGGTDQLDLQVEIGRATTDTLFNSNSAPLKKYSRQPVVIVITFDSAATPAVHAWVAPYLPTGSSGFVEVTWGTSTSGSGALLSAASQEVTVGNINISGARNRLVNGNMWVFAQSQRILGSRQFDRFIREGINADGGYYLLGENGPQTVIDRSGGKWHGTCEATVRPSSALPMNLSKFRGIPRPVISSVTPSNFYDTQTGIIVDGLYF